MYINANQRTPGFYSEVVSAACLTSVNQLEVISLEDSQHQFPFRGMGVLMRKL